MPRSELNKCSLFELHQLIHTKQCSAVEIANDCIHRINHREAVVQAFEQFDEQSVIECAKQIDSGDSAGMLRGLPIAVKDVIDVKDLPSTWGSQIYSNRVPIWDASCVALCRQEGANIFGKTVSTEFAYFYPGKTTNPHNPDHTPGGSSMGSAAAVADFMVPFAFGTQTAASVTRPAAYCGIIGYKASFGSFDLQGVCGLAANLDTLGFLCRDLRDIPLMRSVLCGDTSTLFPRTDDDPPTIGFVPTPHWQEADQDTHQLFENTVNDLNALGATVEEITLPPDFAELAHHHNQVMSFEVAHARASEYLHHRSHLSDQFVNLIETGKEITFEEYQQSKQHAQVARTQLAEIFEDVDVVLAPSAPGEAPHGLDATGNPLFSRMWTLLHVPSVTIPHGKGINDLPLGIQIIGSFNSDTHLIRDADWIQRALSDHPIDTPTRD